jgi:hypothetical protein
MGFTKKIVGESEINSIESNLSEIKKFLNADSIIFLSNEVKNKFDTYEKKYITTRGLTS